ncbi:hypothetical protein ABZ801_26345 [Actinomadura sp. NPDC047616]|uniref:hypothetical protein n=1 Tax=Actinomadura sp. NPDC047616 TaxID=3155914 RepID=UPI0033EEE2DD
MTMLGRRKREAAEKAKKAEKARQRAEEAARKAREAAEAAERAAREAAEAEAEQAEAEQRDEAEADTETKVETKSKSKAESKSKGKDAPEAEDGSEASDEPEKPAEASDDEGDSEAGDDTPETAEDADSAEETDKSGSRETDAAEADAEETDAEDAEDEDKPVLTKAKATKTKSKTTEAEDDAEQAEDDDEDERAPGRARRFVEAVASAGAPGYALIAVNVALAVGLAWLVLAVNRAGDQEAAADQVKFAASRAAEDLSSYDFRTIDADLKRATGQTTGEFRTEFQRLTGTVRTSATQQQAVVEGTAVKTAVESVDGDRAVALVFLNQQTAKGSSGQRTPSQFSMRLVMRKIGDRWLVSELQML